MNKQLFFFRTAIIAVFVLALASCSKTNKEGRLVPANASYVMHLNGSQISTKLSWDDVKTSEFFKQIAADSTVPPIVMEALNNPDKSGIDIKKDLLGYFVLDKQGAYVGLTGSITDAEKFGQFNKGIIEDGTEKQDGSVKYISAKPLFLGYDKEKFVYLINTPFFHRAFSVKEKDKGSWDMQQIITDIFKMPADKSLSNNSKFTKLLSDNADAHVWYNGEAMARGASLTEIMPLIDFEKFTKDLASATSINFNNGNISLKTRIYTSKALSDVFKKYEGGKINEAMVNKLPVNGINAALAINFKPEVIRELIKLTGMDGLANSELKREAGISLDDFIKANKGDLLIAISNLHAKKDSFTLDMGTGPKKTIYNNRPEMDYLFAASVNDKEAFNKLIDAAKDKAKDFDEEDSASAQVNSPAYSFNDQYFVFGKSKTIVDSYASNNGNNDALLKKIGNGPIGGYADIQSVLKAMEPEATADSTDKAIHALSLQMWDNATLKGGQVEDGALVFDIELNLLDKNTNSLKQLSNYFQKVTSLSREKERKEREAFLNDMPPAPEKFIAPKSK